ncbi:MAG: hypothetical protein IK079_04450, partial [Desulfovibrio sp.]|nr:hypothetical protein [Desulfovibrio sp.]
HPLDEWNTHIVFKQCNQNFHQAIDPDNINVIDFLEVHEKCYKVAGSISEIFEKLNKGICLIATQKKTGEIYGRGGEFGVEKARLAVSLFKYASTKDGVIGSCRVTKLKNFINKNIEGRELFYHLKNGTSYYFGDTEGLEFLPSDYWLYSKQDRKKLIETIQKNCQYC